MQRDGLDDMKDNDAPSLESMLDVKLEVLLHDLVTQHGPVETAKRLGVNYKTVARSAESGKLSVHLRQVLTVWLLSRGVFRRRREGRSRGTWRKRWNSWRWRCATPSETSAGW